MKTRVACLGHRVYFENHFCELKSRFFDVAWFDYDHFSNVVYDDIRLFRPDITLIYRPELHKAANLTAIPGYKIGFSTEPLPKIAVDGTVKTSSETDRRLSMISHLQKDGFNRIYHYDKGSKSFIEQNGLPIDDYAVIPVNTNYFNPSRMPKQKWDILFLGKATERRSRILSRLKNHNVSFLWIEHGVSGSELGKLFKRSRCILNIHADDIQALAPRVYLAAACGVPVLTDPTGDTDFPFSRLVRTVDMNELSLNVVKYNVEDVKDSGVLSDREYLDRCLDDISVERFLMNTIDKII
ncbi:hypothetical protein CES85_5307 [Ochrobactrum quorumnocens]|uniref:Spore protein YkvP/CgeB glycosyl transferase-like domain-containing protein n=1 Tax=Ochrobactrum quorumnocens TaxID=271865 RepID=A0A248UD21_9HYPH|nr:hypothetical protein [[Ochrobactrum] quorumnocens]ASV84512.1 hypothetical protein CES85_5307 [[Ochrobactrum] quorumnocens]